MRDCWVLVGFGPDPYCPQRPLCRPLARADLSALGGHRSWELLFCQVQVRAFNRLYYLSAKIVQSVRVFTAPLSHIP